MENLHENKMCPLLSVAFNRYEHCDTNCMWLITNRYGFLNCAIAAFVDQLEEKQSVLVNRKPPSEA